jgi:hypothetical protein
VREKFRHKLVRRFVPILRGIVTQGIAEGSFHVESPQETAHVLMMLIQGMQEEATELFVARQANAIEYEEVAKRFDASARAFERMLGADAGSINFVDQSILREWYGYGTRRPHDGDHRG